ncbi:DNA polymerase/3'-5' exonuclease PolX [Chryseomicrobium excrementi]|uniref:DNA-directed DNA polymerase n=1 Tax=Chryseomicrobium excrementi TaxID=2041346 RepID=A0A2M9F1U5_9BACL|nr:DNA polymerase/3'-5' exonuclease PolX [Chryseomicrobium excrementi]PJK17431.1 DNA polymerase/3'-5' exonuclease PolX [Chryseomicrobium excrementi]
MDKKTIIRTLERIALLMELQGENPFKVSAFRKAAQTLELDSRSLSEMDDPTKLKGIGAATGGVITDLLQDGESTLLLELEKQVPQGLVEMLQIPGMGGKKIAKLYAELGIETLEGLREACEKNEVQALAGFGKKTEEKILKELDQLASRPERYPIWKLEPIVEHIESLLKNHQDVSNASVAGSYRRTKETSKDLDFVIATDHVESVKEMLKKSLDIEEMIADGDTKMSVALAKPERVDVDFRFVVESEFASTLHHFTGSKDHNIRMRQLAKEKDWKISEYGVEKEDGTVTTYASESEFFADFDLPFIPPSIRESGQELDRLDELKDLVQLENIVSDLHMHTTWSDGAHSLEEMIEGCIAKDYKLMVITDHSRYLRVANGLTPERLREQNEKIKELQKIYPDIHILSGTEMDILPDGTLDFDDELLAELDFVIASIHSSFSQPQEKIMERLFAAVSNPHVDMIAHPTGRIVGERDGYEPDVEQLLQWAKEYDKIVELNANPYRLDLAVPWLERAQELGVKVAINTDAHHLDHLRFMDIGVRHAQKAWLTKETIVNTWEPKKLLDYLSRN